MTTYLCASCTETLGEEMLHTTKECPTENTPLHEFVVYKDSPYCGFSLSSTPGHRCGLLPNAAVHQVAKGPCRKCGEMVVHDKITCPFVFGRDKSLYRAVPVRDSERTFVPAEAHQTPEPQKVKCGDCSEGELHDPSCRYSGTVEYVQCVIDDDESAPPDQHVAPPRIWIGLEHGRVYSGRPLKNTVEYLAAAPIKAALEAIEANMILGVAVAFDRPLWDALVKSVKGSSK